MQKFKDIKKRLGEFLMKIDLKDVSYIGISAFNGENIIKRKFDDKSSLIELMES